MKKNHNHHHGQGYISIDYCASQSKIANWNPTFKVLFAVTNAIISVASNSISVSLTILLVTSYITLIKGKIDFHYYVKLLLIPITFAILSTIAIMVNFNKVPLGEYNLKIFSIYLYATQESIYRAFKIFIKAFSGISSIYMMTLSTTSYEVINVLKKIRLPKIVIELMNMIYRYIFILLEVQNKMSISANSRLGYRDLKTSYKSFCGILINLFVVSFKKASEYYDALEARCYDGELLFLYEEKPLDKGHVIYASLFIISLILIKLLVRI